MRILLPVYLLFGTILSFCLNASSHHPEDFLARIKGSKDEGLQIYQHFCFNCHAQKPLISLGAPRFKEESDWAIRLKQDINILFKHTEEGINAMPPMGGCFECTDQQLILAVVEMVPSEAQKSLKNNLEEYIKIKK